MQAYEYVKTYPKEDKDDRDSVQLVYEQDTHDCLIQVSTALVYCDLDGWPSVKINENKKMTSQTDITDQQHKTANLSTLSNNC